jgi:ABC-2 type transport system ATP-binding protein
VAALDDVSFALHPGEICAVVGPNGAGKSTLFRILIGLTTATSGDVEVLGIPAAKAGAAVRRQIGFASADDRSLLLRQTCYHNLAFHGRLQGLPERQLSGRIAEVLELVGLSHATDRAGFALSAGMRARLQLARALLHEPRLLILDEPTGTVDPLGAHEILGVIQTIVREKNMALIISSHRLEEIEALRDRVLLLDKGRVVYDGDLGSLRRVWDRPKVALTVAATGRDECRAALARHPSVELIDEPGEELVFATDQPIGLVLQECKVPLEDVLRIDEREMALRDLLAIVYRRGSAPARPA